MTVPIRSGTVRVALVGCGASKLGHAAPARELYTGDLFRKASAWAQTHADRWYVLSARHGLVHPDTVLEPYDQRMPTDVDSKRTWAMQVDATLRCQNADLSRYSMHSRDTDPDVMGLGAHVMSGHTVAITMLAGAAYCEVLAPKVATWATVTRPLAGLGIGQQKAALLRDLDLLAS